MARKTFELQYSVGREQTSAYITKMSADRFIAFLTVDGRKTHSREMNAAEYGALIHRLYDEFPHAEHDFGSLGRIAAFVIRGNYDADAEDIQLELALEC